MEPPDAASRQSVGLPSINHLDADRVKREEVEHQRKHSSPAMVSPLHPYSGPSHSYSNHQSNSANSVPGSLGGLLSPPESRRTSGDEKDQRVPARQSLPSIHEALGSEQPLSYPPPPPTSVSQSYLPPPPPSSTSPSDTRGRTFSADHINPFSHSRSPFLNTSPSVAPPPPPPAPAESISRHSSFSAPQPNSRLPSLHLRTTQSPPPGSSRPHPTHNSYPPQASPAYESSTAPYSAGSMNYPHGYHYPPTSSAYPLSAPLSNAHNPGYPSSPATFSAPPAPPRYPQWKPDNAELGRYETKKTSLAPYGESVKRHLESFDLEASLNEMAEGAGRVADFSKVYRQRAHENQRIGMTPQSMPRLDEVDDMIKHSERIAISLQRMREVVVNHQQANIVEPPREAHYRPVNGYDHDSQNSFQEDPKSNSSFAGTDNKKRRQRAAPPGRCHSCNRAETPEWRRGPDGARTLCNACGLHYAKLTRKMGGKQAMGSSNLRPKALGEGSPAS